MKNKTKVVIVRFPAKARAMRSKQKTQKTQKGKVYVGPVRIIAICGILGLTTGCTTMTGESLFVGEDEGRFLLSTDRAGMQEFGRALAGIGQVAKDSPDVKGAYWQAQEKETEYKGFRIQIRDSKKGGKK